MNLHRFLVSSKEKRSARIRRRPLVGEPLEPRRVLDSTVVLNELMYNPVGPDDGLEWIELHNQMAVDMDVSHWKLDDGVQYDIPEGTVIPGGGYLVIASDPSGLEAARGISNVLGPFQGRLNNGGERLRLISNDQRLMDQVDYQDRDLWPVGPDGSGVSLAKLDPQSGSPSPENWTASAEMGGTPGAENFPSTDLSSSVTTLVPIGASWRLSPTGANLGTGWRKPDLDDSSWGEGQAILFAGQPEGFARPDQVEAVGTLAPVPLRNPSFEDNTNGGVGYGTISGWRTAGGTGVNPASNGAAPFADNGQIPDRQRVALIQGAGSLSQTVRGLDPTRQYLVQLYYNARGCCGANPGLSVSFAGTELIHLPELTPVGGSDPYYFVSAAFTPAASTGELVIRNIGTGGDHTLLVDAVSVVQRDSDRNVVQNPSFEASGSAASPTFFRGEPLAGWQFADLGGGQFGLTGDDPALADNGQLPDGDHVLFLQQPGALSQVLEGLVPGQRYALQYQTNARAAAETAHLRVTVGETVVADQDVTPVGGQQPYHVAVHTFTAGSSSERLTFQQTASSDTSDPTVLLDNISVRQLASPLVTELPLGDSTYYFRHAFSYDGDPQLTSLTARLLVDDGAVFYLNGVEVLRTNMPDGPVDYQTKAGTAVGQPEWSEPVPMATGGLVRGENVLAVEVHQAVAADSDMALALELKAEQQPRPPVPPPLLVLNEIAGAADNVFQVELANLGDRPVQLAGTVLVTEGGDGGAFVLPERILDPGGYVSFDETGLGFDANAGNRLFLYSPDKTRLLDAQRVTDTLRGRRIEDNGRWLLPAEPTFGAENRFDLTTDVVINEIMYHGPTHAAVQGKPPVYQSNSIVPLNATWRFSRHFNFGPTDLPYDPGPRWQEVAHQVDGNNWLEGPGPLGFSRAQSSRLQTRLADPRLVTNFITSYYFESEFGLSQQQIDELDDLTMRQFIDDGAVFYLNGQEIHRFNMPPGVAETNTLALSEIRLATQTDSDAIISKDLLVALPAMNRLSVEVHQASTSSEDVVFGMELLGRQLVSPGSPAVPPVESNEEWIELLNRGDSTVDLSGWKLTDAAEYTFPSPTQLSPGELLVVARDRQALAAQYPEISDRIVGDYSGQLANGGERVLLLDARGNPADEVHYYDDRPWPSAADGGGSSLELRDPWADNSVAEVWAASREGERSAWKTYTYRGSGSEPAGAHNPTRFHELIIGLLDAGEVLIDDIRVVEDPDGDAVDLLQNGSFQADAVGSPPRAWRAVGNHDRSRVIQDPDDPANKVLRLVATGATEHMSNHAETTLAGGARVSRNKEYEISFRARWVSGSPQVNTRLYFNRAAHTTIVDVPQRHGTPGVANSTRVDNLGPVYRQLRHQPLVPTADDEVTVSVRADDGDGVASLVLYYAVDRGSFTRLSMQRQADGRFSAVIPPQRARRTVQFYVEGTDSRGAVSTFPAEGADSRALYRVASRQLDRDQVHSLRVIMTPEDVAFMHADTNVMSNDRLGATVIYDDRQVFYDVGIRLRASGFGRRGQLAGFNIRFHADQRFRGVQRSIALDRGVVLSNGNGTGGVRGVAGASPHELLIYQIAHHAGSIPAMYDDVVYVEAPRSTNTGLALLKLARYSNDYLDSQFAGGSQGPLLKYELIYYSTQTTDGDPESLKRAPDSVMATDISDLGDDREAYRMNFVLRNNRDRDEFDRLVDLGKAFSLRGDALAAATEEVMDVDEWMRLVALQSLTGGADSYNMGLAHNMMFYVRPEDNKVLALPWDVDHGFFYESSSPLLGRGGSNLKKVIALPQNTRLVYKHLLDLIETTYNTDYLSPWIDHYTQVTGVDLADFFKNYVDARVRFVRQQLQAVAPKIPLEITTNDGNDLTVDGPATTLQGTGWIDVDQIRLKGSGEPLEVTWTDQDRWQVVLPLAPGENRLTLEAYNRRGELVGSDLITVTSTVPNGLVVGDSNRDGRFDQLDIVFALQGAKYLTGEPAGWAEGDWNSDGVFDQLDIVAALRAGQYQTSPRPQALR